MIEKIERMAMLFDFYGKLLTKKQREMLSLHYEHDLSLGEIAEENGVSRQAVHDVLKRSEKILEGYERELGLLRKYTVERERLEKALGLVDGLTGNDSLKDEIRRAIKEVLDLQNVD